MGYEQEKVGRVRGNQKRQREEGKRNRFNGIKKPEQKTALNSLPTLYL